MKNETFSVERVAASARLLEVGAGLQCISKPSNGKKGEKIDMLAKIM